MQRNHRVWPMSFPRHHFQKRKLNCTVTKTWDCLRALTGQAWGRNWSCVVSHSWCVCYTDGVFVTLTVCHLFTAEELGPREQCSGNRPEERDAEPCPEPCWGTSSGVQGEKGGGDVVPAYWEHEGESSGLPYLTLRPFTDVIILSLMSPFTVNTLTLQWICLSFHEDSTAPLILPDADAASDLT